MRQLDNKVTATRALTTATCSLSLFPYHPFLMTSTTEQRDRSDTNSDITTSGIVCFAMQAISLADWCWEVDGRLDLAFVCTLQYTRHRHHEEDCPPQARTKESHTLLKCEHMFLEVFFLHVFIPRRPLLWAFNHVYLVVDFSRHLLRSVSFG